MTRLSSLRTFLPLIAVLGAVICVHVAFVARSDHPKRTWYIPFAGEWLLAERTPDLHWTDEDVTTCSDHADCMAKATVAIAEARALEGSERPEAPYLAYENLKRAELLVGASDAPQADFDRLRDELQERHGQLSSSYIDAMTQANGYRQRTSYALSTKKTLELQAQFPGERSSWGRGAKAHEQVMRNGGHWVEP